MAAPTDLKVIRALAEEFSDPLEAKTLVERAELRRGRQPGWQTGNAELFWSEVHRLFKGGAVLGGWPKLLREAHLERPSNPVITAAAAAAGIPIASAPGDAGAATDGSPGSGSTSTAGYAGGTADSAAGTDGSATGAAGSAAGTAGAGRPTTASGRATDPDSDWDFFISYTGADQGWAEWIAWQLEEAGYRVYLQAWDFVAGSNWMNMMTRGIEHSQRTIAVLSSAYMTSVWGAAEWQAALRHDPDGFKRKVLPVRIENCPRPELLEGVVSVDLFGLVRDQAKERLLDTVTSVVAGRKKPATEPDFPPDGPGSTP
ncbi:TIR domain-containing protein [Parafrankia irregularis]|uniref:TIR domain-containing protein n=1 Tax=Parafrankia irregularis TaxID=795642 RepID=A0A0S4R382_9ACTN|nr:MULTISPECIES: toll/interleukin-1 receptor domain-containing protein [Parafrankia]MBE3202292.1 toll/interleukin-1 receptor domain-containing protein [Parafrankia sp. CH37]CUU61226.1 TIR domain-containing protein [Parafrankia irregularis]